MKKLVRSRKGKVVAGVAKGIADYFNLDVTLIRIIWIFLFIPGGLPGLLPYLLLWLLMPRENDSSEEK